nr:uncharacterized protein LOC129264313 [Lytechinus pictus]
MTWWLVRENDQLFLIVNGRRAFSRNRSIAFSRVKGMTVHPGGSNQQDDQVLITFSDGNQTTAKFHQIDLEKVADTLGKPEERLQDILSTVKAITEDLIYNCEDSEDSESSLGTGSSTSLESEAIEPRKKKRKIEENTIGNVDAQIEEKCRGISEIELKKLCAPERDAKRYARKEIVAAKEFLMSRHSDMVIPVLEKSGKYEVLGGMSYINASKFIGYGHLSRGWRCRVYHNLNRIEALRVASLFRIGQPVEEGLSLQEEVAICRSILYSDHGLEVDAHPPKMTAPTRKHCAVALGRSDAKNSLRALEPTFQLASYSSRCYEKVTELFNLVQETTGRNLKQFCFMKLQGLAEEERYRLLIQACTSLNVKGMMKEAEACKAKKYLQNFFTKGVGTLTWAEAMAKHPAHTTEEAMKPYIGLKWKKGMIPEAFLDHINSAKRSLDRDRPTDSIPALAIHEINTDRRKSGKYEVLGGMSYINASKELVDEAPALHLHSPLTQVTFSFLKPLDHMFHEASRSCRRRRYELLIQACTSLQCEKGMMKEAEACKAKVPTELFTKGVGTLTWARPGSLWRKCSDFNFRSDHGEREMLAMR